MKGSELDKIPGIGPNKRAQLLKHFKSLKNIKAASLAELQQVMGKATGQTVYDYFNGKEKTI